MKFLVVLAAAVACAAAFTVEWDADEEIQYSTVRKGGRSDAVDDAQSTVSCNKHEVMAKCECEDASTCDGAWIRSSAVEDQCVVWTRAPGKEGDKIRGAVPIATCVRLFVATEAGKEGGENPTTGCPDKYARVGCNLHTHYRQAESPNMGITQKKGICTVYGDCVSHDCKVQAICIRNKDA